MAGRKVVQFQSSTPARASGLSGLVWQVRADNGILTQLGGLYHAFKVPFIPDEVFGSHNLPGLPFPLLDPNDRQVATKVMWKFSFRLQ